MNTMIESIRELKIPVHSHIRAVQAFNDRVRDGVMSNESVALLLQRMVGENAQPLSGEYARIQVAYLIQEAVRNHIEGHEVAPMELYNRATAQAQIYIETHPWVFAEKEQQELVAMDGEITIKPKTRSKKGAKQDQAAQLYRENRDKLTQNEMIQLFMDKLNMTIAGARTYVYNNKKTQGPCKDGTTGRAKRGLSKGKRALELYKKHHKQMSKDQLIELFMKELETSKAGATTQYYAAKKEVG